MLDQRDASPISRCPCSVPPPTSGKAQTMAQFPALFGSTWMMTCLCSSTAGRKAPRKAAERHGRGLHGVGMTPLRERIWEWLCIRKVRSDLSPYGSCLPCQLAAAALLRRTGTDYLGDKPGNRGPLLRRVITCEAACREPLVKTGRGEPPCIAQAGSKDFVGRYRSHQAGESDWSMTEPCSA